MKENNVPSNSNTDETSLASHTATSGNANEQGWTKDKPELNKECLLLTANFYRHPKYPENSYWSYRLFEIAKIEFDGEWYWGVLEEGMEWGGIADIKADLYKVIPLSNGAPNPEVCDATKADKR